MDPRPMSARGRCSSAGKVKPNSRPRQHDRATICQAEYEFNSKPPFCTREWPPAMNLAICPARPVSEIRLLLHPALALNLKPPDGSVLTGEGRSSPRRWLGALSIEGPNTASYHTVIWREIDSDQLPKCVVTGPGTFGQIVSLSARDPAALHPTLPDSGISPDLWAFVGYPQ